MPRPRRFALALRFTLGCALIPLAAPAAATALLTVEVATDYLAGSDFIVARTTVSIDDRIYGRDQAIFFVGDRAPFRVAELELPTLPPGTWYTVEVELVHSTGRPIARREVDVEFRHNHVVTLLMLKPTGTAEKTVALIADNDGDGAVSAGDMLRYTVVVDGDIARFSDDPGPGLRLDIGSVTTSYGRVTRGNSGVDFLVVVDDLQGAPGPVTITFDCEVMPVLENQGDLWLAPPGATSRFVLTRLPTDDPSTSVSGDATRTLVTCTGGQRCVEDLAACRRERDALLADPDRDGVAAVLDLCTKTPLGTAVDDRGCAQGQFCARIDVRKPQGEAICRAADWRGDEPLGSPQDCRPVKGVCVAD